MSALDQSDAGGARSTPFRRRVALGAALLACLALASSALAGTNYYYYDALGRLTRVDYPTYSVVYTYDAAGNRTSQVIQSNTGTTWGYFNWGGASWTSAS